MTETIHTIIYDELMNSGRVNSEQTVRVAFGRVMQEFNKMGDRGLVSLHDKGDLDAEVTKENVPAIREIIKAALTDRF